jgi:hypothetical protein
VCETLWLRCFNQRKFKPGGTTTRADHRVSIDHGWQRTRDRVRVATSGRGGDGNARQSSGESWRSMRIIRTPLLQRPRLARHEVARRPPSAAPIIEALPSVVPRRANMSGLDHRDLSTGTIHIAPMGPMGGGKGGGGTMEVSL